MTYIVSIAFGNHHVHFWWLGTDNFHVQGFRWQVDLTAISLVDRNCWNFPKHLCKIQNLYFLQFVLKLIKVWTLKFKKNSFLFQGSEDRNLKFFLVWTFPCIPYRYYHRNALVSNYYHNTILFQITLFQYLPKISKQIVKVMHKI